MRRAERLLLHSTIYGAGLAVALLKSDDRSNVIQQTRIVVVQVIEECWIIVGIPAVVAVPAIVVIRAPLLTHLSVELRSLCGIHSSPVRTVKSAFVIPVLLFPLPLFVAPSIAFSVVIAVLPITMVVIPITAMRVRHGWNRADQRNQDGH